MLHLLPHWLEVLDNDTLSVKEQFGSLWISYEDIFVDVKPVDRTYFCGPNFIIELSYAWPEGMEGSIIIVQNPVRDQETTRQRQKLGTEVSGN